MAGPPRLRTLGGFQVQGGFEQMNDLRVQRPPIFFGAVSKPVVKVFGQAEGDSRCRFHRTMVTPPWWYSGVTLTLLGGRIMATRGSCLVEGCAKAKYIRGWCRAHYARWQRWGSPTGGTYPDPNRECSVEGCDRVVGRKGARGWCPKHYQRYLSAGSPTGSTRPTDVDRFFNFVRKAGDCWEWTGARDGSGYGMFSDRRKDQFAQRSHRWSYRYFLADIPDKLQIDHLCRNRACCNPWHLEPVTPLVNSRRGLGSGARVFCPQGHRYITENTYLTPDGKRVCRKCAAESRKRYESKKRMAS